MPLVAAAVCPHPPLIVPEIAGAAAPELDELRAACDAAVARLVGSGAEHLLIVGADSASAELPAPYRGSFRPWGAPVTVTLGQAGEAGTTGLPLSLLVGAWLVGRTPADAAPNCRMTAVGRDETVSRCAQLGARSGDDRPWALLAMGDGSACHGTKSPGYDDPRAGAYDEGVARALADADAEALLALDPVCSAELLVAGRAPWQVLAGAARAAGGRWRGELTHRAAPYGVGYLVATWAPA